LRETLLGMEDVSALKKSLDDARSLVSLRQRVATQQFSRKNRWRRSANY
jgi:hypothetical protein